MVGFVISVPPHYLGIPLCGLLENGVPRTINRDEALNITLLGASLNYSILP